MKVDPILTIIQIKAHKALGNRTPCAIIIHNNFNIEGAENRLELNAQQLAYAISFLQEEAIGMNVNSWYSLSNMCSSDFGIFSGNSCFCYAALFVMQMRLGNNLEQLPTQNVAHHPHPHPTPLGRMTETPFFYAIAFPTVTLVIQLRIKMFSPNPSPKKINCFVDLS